MRIISGQNRGLRLASVGKGDSAAHLRPTSDRVRESIFNLLMGGAYGDPISGACVLDLFAGTGALGLEALSRGATHVCFIDNGAKAQSLIRKNIEICRAGGSTRTIRRDATRLADCPGGPVDLIFLDPPYGQGLGEKALASAQSGGWLAAGALVVFEEGRELPPPPGFDLSDQRRYGNSYVSILRSESPA